MIYELYLKQQLQRIIFENFQVVSLGESGTYC